MIKIFSMATPPFAKTPPHLTNSKQDDLLESS